MDFYTKKEYRKGWGEILIFFECYPNSLSVMGKIYMIYFLTLYGFSFDKADRLFQKV